MSFPDEAIIEEWDRAHSHLMDARDHLKQHLGKPGERLAKRDFYAALEAYNAASDKLESDDADRT